MSRLTRNPGVQGLLARVLSAYLRWTLSTIRWRWSEREIPETVWAAGGGVIVCFWHSRLLMAPAIWPATLGQEARALISLSPDGEFIARAMGRLGFPAIRGSSAKKSDPAKAKGGAAAVRDGLKWLRGGGALAITPDGPRGPAEVMAEGPPMLAGMGDAPVLLAGIACKPCLRMNSWDRAVIPLPFARGAIVWEGPIRVDPKTPATALAMLSRDWSGRLSAVTQAAEAALGVTAALILYRMGLGAIEPLAPMLLRRRARRGKEDPTRLGERLGRASAARPEGPLIWLHGASVGETLSLLPLVQGLRGARPAPVLLVTSGTVTSATLLARRLPEGVIHQYVPVDAPRAARRFLEHWRPDVVVLVESELWPNLLLEAQARGARLALLSARLSADSVGGWARAAGAARRLLSGFDLVMGQDDDAARRLERLGAHDDGRLNLKLAGDPLPVDAVALEQARAAATGRPVLLAASTHLGEDEAVLDAFAQLGDPWRRRLVIAPRHPARGPAVAELAQSRGLTTARCGAGEAFGSAPVYVADTLGELGLWLRLCRAAFIGGGLVPGVGGHNPLEPARLDRPFASGPNVSNWRSVYEALHRVGGATVVRDAGELAAFWRAAEADAPELAAQAARAAGFARTQAGAVDDAVARLLELLP